MEHEMLRRRKAEEEEREGLWESGSGSSKDSGGDGKLLFYSNNCMYLYFYCSGFIANQFYAVNIEDSEEDYINDGNEGLIAAGQFKLSSMLAIIYSLF